MNVGDLVKNRYPLDPNSNDNVVGLIVDWHVIYDRFGDPVEKMAVVHWPGVNRFEIEYPDMLKKANEKKKGKECNEARNTKIYR